MLTNNRIRLSSQKFNIRSGLCLKSLFFTSFSYDDKSMLWKGVKKRDGKINILVRTEGRNNKKRAIMFFLWMKKMGLDGREKNRRFLMPIFRNAFLNGFGIRKNLVGTIGCHGIPLAKAMKKSGKKKFFERRKKSPLPLLFLYGKSLIPEISRRGMTITDMFCFGIGQKSVCKSTRRRKHEIKFRKIKTFYCCWHTSNKHSSGNAPG